MAFSSLHSQSDEDFERSGCHYRQPHAGLLLQRFNDAWINNKGGIDEAWFGEGFQFVTPLVTVTSFTDFSEWFERILPHISAAEIVQQFSDDECTCCIVNVTVGNEAKILRIAQLVTFENNHISEIEWLFDPHGVAEIFNR